MFLNFLHDLVSSFITTRIMVLSCCRKYALPKKLSEFLEPWSLSELWEPLCRTDGISIPNYTAQSFLSEAGKVWTTTAYKVLIIGKQVQSKLMVGCK